MTTPAGHQRQREQHLRYARACEVSAWIPSPEQIAAASERTDGMVALYVHHGAKAEHLATLVRSAYLQGAQDTAMVAARMRAGVPIS